MIELFFDDSGKESWEREEYVCMAGYFGFESLFDGYVSQLEGLLLRHNISCIHMKDLIHLQGEYKKLGWDSQKRDMVLSEFIKIIKDNQLIGIGVGIDVVSWRNIPLEIRKKYAKGGVQDFCFQRIIRRSIEMLNIFKPKHDLIHLILDTDPKFAPARFELFSKIRKHDPKAREYLTSITFADSKIYTPLQAADFLAWETRKNLIQKARNYDYTKRWKELFSVLTGHESNYVGEFWDREELHRIWKP